MTGRTLFPIGGDDDHLTERLGRLLEALEPVRENSVVVREEEPHQRPSLADSNWRIRSRRSCSIDSSVSTANASRDTRRSSPALRCSFSFCRAPSIVYFSV